MNDAGIDIDWIVREVVRRLREQLVSSNGNAKTQRSSESATTAGELQLDDKLVTVKTLDGRLGQVQRVVVRPQAIITPAAKDLLKEKKVALQRGNTSETKPAQAIESTLQVIVAVAGIETNALTKLLGDKIRVINMTSQSSEATKQAIACAAGGGRAALVTDAPAAAVMQANRNASVRAALGHNYPAIRNAVTQIDANMIVLESAGRSVAELGGMIGEFFRRSQ